MPGPGGAGTTLEVVELKPSRPWLLARFG